jgi:hypothetical protein
MTFPSRLIWCGRCRPGFGQFGTFDTSTEIADNVQGVEHQTPRVGIVRVVETTREDHKNENSGSNALFAWDMFWTSCTLDHVSSMAAQSRRSTVPFGELRRNVEYRVWVRRKESIFSQRWQFSPFGRGHRTSSRTFPDNDVRRPAVWIAHASGVLRP